MGFKLQNAYILQANGDTKTESTVVYTCYVKNKMLQIPEKKIDGNDFLFNSLIK
ncbi:hypothetical protein Pedsa_1298 [Pseudopedobacter saltans DSM 12145]|uniref:Uncharacterized protein n=1 Tax=Pseudopedobacter saltans (strain ATCC 51119 / DSM 12145 / JCM 21818 / CCUG 39354 / LMG 10337 / NBRC 100064 / NCIMB 13643) TaxID=762903 RepID=F0SDW9_PSESL|nr:hypothetical protein [Pseudopedobacter saltans]ADY51865.1 hypothetical protein Pedsa_1298 [Pseudopedobacter saltans DSM 12145]